MGVEQSSDIKAASGKRYLRQTKSFAIAFLLCTAVFSLLVVASELIPRSALRENVVESNATLQAEGAYPAILGGYDTHWQLDNYTNAIMIHTAFTDNGSIFESAFAGYRHYLTGDPLTDLDSYVEDGEFGGIYSYPRYWHGWLILVRPLLMLLNLQQIRMVFFAAMTAAIAGVTVLITRARKGSSFAAVGFAVMMACLSYPVVCFSMSLWFSFMVALVFMLLIAYDNLKAGRLLNVTATSFGWLPLCMFYAGAVTVFFDFLCTPVVSLGLPLALFVYLHADEKWAKSTKRMLLLVVYCSVAWGAGYLLLWAAKWALASLALGWNVFDDAFNQLFIRSSTHTSNAGGVVNFSRFKAISDNVRMLLPGWAKGTLLIGLICLVLYLLKKRRNFKSMYVAPLLALLVIGAIPYAWFFVTANHCFIHFWFTWRNQAVAVYAAILIVALLLNGAADVPRKDIDAGSIAERSGSMGA